ARLCPVARAHVLAACAASTALRMSLRLPSGASPTGAPLGLTMRRVYAPSGRACLPAMKSFGVRSIAGSVCVEGRGEDEGRAEGRGAGDEGRDARFTYSHMPS